MLYKKIIAKILFITLLLIPLIEAKPIVDDAANFHLKLIQNDHPSPVLLDCEISVNKDQITFSSSGYVASRESILWNPDPKGIKAFKKFKNHSITLSDKQFAADLITITKNASLCNNYTHSLVSGGFITKIECSSNDSEKVSLYYLLNDRSNLKAVMMEGLGHYFQAYILAIISKDHASIKASQSECKSEVSKLAIRIRDYNKALSLLNSAYRSGKPAEWRRIRSLIQYRVTSGPLAQRSQLVKKAHEVLTAACSRESLNYILGEDANKTQALLMRVQLVRRCRGSWTGDQLQEYYGYDDLPGSPHLPVYMLDLGLERLIIHFSLQDMKGAAAAFNQFTLSVNERSWSINRVESYAFKTSKIPMQTEPRIDYLSTKSKLLDSLLPDSHEFKNVALLNIDAISIENDQWKTSRIDYTLGKNKLIQPFFLEQNKWQPNKLWEHRSYFHTEHVFQNNDYFRPIKDVVRHNGDADK